MAVWAACVGGPRAALANGAFPDEFSVFFPASHPHRILLAANFGLVVSEDDGATWRYACEPWITQGLAVALSPYSVDYYQVCADGAVLAQSIRLTRSGDDACTWPQSSGSIDNHVVADIFADPKDAQFALAIIIDSSGGNSIVASHDGGKTFDSPALYSTSAVLTGIEIAKSDSSVLYATSISNSPVETLLLRSVDRGATWTPSSIPEDPGTQPVIMAIDPTDPTTVYLRVTSAQTDSIVVAHSGGASFETVLSINGLFTAFVLGTDGTLYAGTNPGQLYVRAPGATAFAMLTGPHSRCLGQRPGTSRLYACGDFQIDGFSLGYSDDGGKTFSRLMNFTDILGPLTCTPVTANCQAHWERVQQVLGVGDAGTGGGDAGTADAGPSDGGAPADGGTTPGRSGKSCESSGAGVAALVTLGLIVLARRRSWKHTRH